MLNYKNLTVYKTFTKRLFCGDYEPRPQIKLSGKWLEKAGFEPGQKFTAIIEDGKITLVNSLNFQKHEQI